jgi:hypothetical protein
MKVDYDFLVLRDDERFKKLLEKGAKNATK